METKMTYIGDTYYTTRELVVKLRFFSNAVGSFGCPTFYIPETPVKCFNKL